MQSIERMTHPYGGYDMGHTGTTGTLPQSWEDMMWTSLGFFGSAKVVQGGIVISFLSKENMGV